MNEAITHPRNPVYDHLIRNQRAPSVLATILIAVALSIAWAAINGLLFWNAIVTSSGQNLSNFTPLSWAVIWISLLVFAISPLVTAVITALNTANSADDEHLTLLKLTGLTPKSIVSGYVRAAIFRLRILWAICYGLLLPLFVSLFTILLMVSRFVPDPSRDLFDTAPAALEESLGIVVVGAILGTAINWVALCVGVWAGLRFTTLGAAISIPLAIVFFMPIVILPVPYVIGLIVSSLGVFGVLIGEVVIWAIAQVMADKFLKWAERRL